MPKRDLSFRSARVNRSRFFSGWIILAANVRARYDEDIKAGDLAASAVAADAELVRHLFDAGKTSLQPTTLIEPDEKAYSFHIGSSWKMRLKPQNYWHPWCASFWPSSLERENERLASAPKQQ
jgi:hypothetical protein